MILEEDGNLRSALNPRGDPKAGRIAVLGRKKESPPSVMSVGLLLLADSGRSADYLWITGLDKALAKVLKPVLEGMNPTKP